MTTLERASLALIESLRINDTSTASVIAVLEAIREPSPDAVNAAVSEFVGDVDAEFTWRRMLDHIINEANQ